VIKTFIQLTVFSLPVFIPGLTNAQAIDNQPTASDFFGEAPIILTASRMSKPLDESPATVSVITRQMIEASGVREIADLFKMVPGFVVGYHKGHIPVVSYGGLGQIYARQMQVLIDNRSVFIPSFGGIPWSNLPLLIEEIERIEIIRGPNAVTYGANAFLATINIITRHASEDFGNSYSVTSSDRSNPDIKDAYLKIGRYFENMDWRISVGSINDDGFAAINDSKKTAKLNFRLDYSNNSDQQWTVHIGTSNSKAGRGFEGRVSDIIRDDEAINTYLNLQWESNQPLVTSTARLTHTRHDVKDHYDPGAITLEDFLETSDPPSGITLHTLIDFDRVSERTDLEFSQTRQLQSQTRLLYGANFRKDRVKSLFLFNDQSYHIKDSQGWFTSLEWKPTKSWLIDLGTMLEDSSLTSQESSNRLSLIYNLAKDHSLRAVGSTAKRNPILWEAEGMTVYPTEIQANGIPLGSTDIIQLQSISNISPEEIRSFEIGLHSNFNNRDLITDVKLYQYEISKHISGDERLIDHTFPYYGDIPLEVTFTKNSDVTEVQGIELEIDVKASKNTKVHASLSFLDKMSTNYDIEHSFPDRSGSLSIQHRINDNHHLSMAWYYTGKIRWADGSIFIDPVDRVDLRYAYYFNILHRTRLEFIGQNLLGDYKDYERRNLQDRVFYLRLSGDF
jgi:iron complex outermembrane recepter protein